tara:strand:+ start:5342 stop:6091 length:750 start_codon:yes stop_codon:yes gene_type:complete
MRNFSTLGLVMGSIFILISGGCADKPLPIKPGTGSPLASANDGGPGSISSGSASGGSNEGFNVPEDSDFARSGNGIQESGVGKDSTSNRFADGSADITGQGSPSGGGDDFRKGPLTGDGSVDNPGSLTGKLFDDGKFHTTPNLNDIFFKYDQHDLSEQSKSILKKNASWLKDNPNVRVQIQGHCDERGTNNYNMALGQRRAQSTKNFLLSLGVSNQIIAESYGEEKPFCVASNENCWSQNRRGHFMVTR